MNRTDNPQVGMLWRSQGSPEDVEEQSRLKNVFDALRRHGVEAQAVPYDDASVDAVRAQLLQLQGVLVWVDPLSDGRDRSLLDPLLRDVASRGVWVSAHPDVVLKMGTKDVLVKTRHLEWGTDCRLYATLDEMTRQLPAALAAGPRVLKQHRGNGGNGVWKVEALATGPIAGLDARIHVLHARRASHLEEMSLRDFIARCAPYFEASGCVIDQPYMTHLDQGMVRCYLVRDHVAGFGHQFVTALAPLPPGVTQSPIPPPRLYYGPDKPEFRALRAKLEGGWVHQMQQALDIARDDLPVLWDADFLYGPKDAAGQDTYVLCEINVSSVLPFPDEALQAIAQDVAGRVGKK